MSSSSSPRLPLQLIKVLNIIFERLVLFYLPWQTLSNLAVAIPEINKLVTTLQLQKILKRTMTIKLKLFLTPGARIEDFCLLQHYKDHTRWSTVPESGSTFLDCLHLNFYHKFPLLPFTDQGLFTEACCFLKPSSPNVFANALLLSTNDGAVNIYRLEPDRYQLAFTLYFEKKIVDFCVSPKGKTVACRNEDGILIFLILGKEGRMLCIETAICAPGINFGKLGQIFLSEKDFYINDFINQHFFTFRLPDIDSNYLSKSMFNCYEELPRFYNRTMFTIHKVDNSEFIIAAIKCQFKTHRYHVLTIVVNPQSKTRSERYNIYFPRSCLGTWLVDDGELFIIVFTTQDLNKFRSSNIKIKRHPVAEICDRFKWPEYLHYLCVYSINLVDFGAGNRNVVPRWHHTSRSERQFTGSWTYYCRHICIAGALLQARITPDCLYVTYDKDFIHFPRKTELGSTHFSYPTGNVQDADLVDVSQDGQFLAAFDTAKRAWRPRIVGLRCPGPLASVTKKAKILPQITCTRSTIDYWIRSIPVGTDTRVIFLLFFTGQSSIYYPLRRSSPQREEPRALLA